VQKDGWLNSGTALACWGGVNMITSLRQLGGKFRGSCAYPKRARRQSKNVYSGNKSSIPAIGGADMIATTIRLAVRGLTGLPPASR